MNTHLKVILKRVEYLRETAKELKYKKSQDETLNELGLEIECYADEIESRVRLITTNWKGWGMNYGY